MFDFDPADDDIDEAEETVSVTGSVTGRAGNFVTGTSFAIGDDDAAPSGIALSVTPVTVSEGDGTRSISVMATPQGTQFSSQVVVTVTVGATGTATLGVDFTAMGSFILTIPPGAASGSGSFNLVPADDSVDETDETVSLTGTSDAGTVTSASITITDNDGAPTGIALSATPESVQEDAGARSISVTAEPQGGTSYADAVVVMVSVGSGTASSGADFSPVSDFEITIPAGAERGTASFDLVPTDDDLDEPDETVALTGTASNAAGVAAGSVTITDGDATPGGIDLSVSSGAVDEDGATQSVDVVATVRGSTRYAGDVVVTVSVGSGTATEGTDFADVTSDVSVTILAGAASGTASFDLVPTDDDLDELDETVALTGTASNGADVAAGSVTITDGDAATGIVLKVMPDRVDENGGPASVMVTATPQGAHFAEEVVVTVRVGSGTAISGTDFAAVDSLKVTIAAGADSGSGSFDLTPLDDSTEEPEETVAVTGQIEANRRGGLGIASAEVTISDDDGLVPPPSSSLPAPSVLSASPQGGTAITLSWSSVPAAASYWIRHAPDDGAPAPRQGGQTGSPGELATGTGHVIEKLLPGRRYEIKVSACASVARDSCGAAAEVEGATVPAAPSGLVLSGLEAGRPSLSWSALMGNEDATFEAGYSKGSLPTSETPRASMGREVTEFEIPSSWLVSSDPKFWLRTVVKSSEGNSELSSSEWQSPRQVAVPTDDPALIEEFDLRQLLGVASRMLSRDAVSVIEGRFSRDGSERQLTLGGRRMEFGGASGQGWPLTGASGRADDFLPSVPRRGARGWRDADGPWDGNASPGSSRASSSDSLSLDSFDWSAGEDRRWTAWGQFVDSSLSGGAALLERGEHRASYFGLESRSEGLLAGLAISRSDISLKRRDLASELDGDLTSVMPYFRRSLDDGASVWGLAALGRGTLRVSAPGAVSSRADLDWGMVAGGFRRPAFEMEGISVSAKIDGAASFLSNDSALRLPGARGDAHWVRMALEGAESWTLEDGFGSVSAAADLGVRADFGDSDRGVGAEIGGRLEYSLPHGFGAWMRGRYLLAHESDDLEEWGASVGVSKSASSGGEGLWFEWSPTWGQTSSETDALWEGGAGSLADDGEKTSSTDLRIGYGLKGMVPVPGLVASRASDEIGSAFVDRSGLWTPYVEWTRTETEDGEVGYSGRYGFRLEVGLLPGGGSVAAAGGRRHGAVMSLGISDGIGGDGDGAVILLRLDYEF